ncbi:hypothetical protein IMSAGC020_01832 [Lachnospiraceae bacterium]|nr:hypothetical protein IMSAGC020_01832 [Lachnospiraceae bacterium]
MRASKPYVQIEPDVLEQARQIDLLSYNVKVVYDIYQTSAKDRQHRRSRKPCGNLCRR